MGLDSKLYNKKTGNKIYCDRYYNLKNVFSYYYDMDDKLDEGATANELLELVEELIFLSGLSTKMLEEIQDKLEKCNHNDIFKLITEHDDDY